LLCARHHRKIFYMLSGDSKEASSHR